ncbi:MAG: flagellar basal body P-ring formation chaperone FlgA [Candidatus Sedimenticola sp. 20ELBAFRAG]
MTILRQMTVTFCTAALLGIARVAAVGIAPFFILSVSASAATADEWQSHETIRQAVRIHAESSVPPSDSRIEIEVGSLDKRLRLHACDQALDTFSPQGRQNSNRLTVGVRCDGAKPWTIYVPVKVAQYKPILVATNGLPKGSTVTMNDVRLEERDVSRLRRGYFRDPSQIVGKTVKRSIQANRALLPSQLVAATAIEKGSMITILARTGGIKVRMKGKALSRGATGDRIKVQNLSSKRKIEATVVGPGIVEVML